MLRSGKRKERHTLLRTSSRVCVELTNLLGTANSATSVSAPVAVALAVHHLVRLMNLLPAPFLFGGRRFVALALFEGNFATEMAEMIEALGAEVSPLDGGAHRAAGFGVVRAVAEAASTCEVRDVF